MTRIVTAALLLLILASTAEGQWQYVGTVWGGEAAAAPPDSTVVGIGVTVHRTRVMLTLWGPPRTCEPAGQLSSPLLKSMPEGEGPVTCQGGPSFPIAARDAIEFADSLAAAAAAPMPAETRVTRVVAGEIAERPAHQPFGVVYTRTARRSGAPAHVLTFNHRSFTRTDQDSAPVLQLAKLLRDAARIASAAAPPSSQ